MDPRAYVAAGAAEARRLAPIGAIESDFVLRAKRGFGVPPGAGTAFLVSPCYALTNYHVVFGNHPLNLDPMADYDVSVRFALAAADAPLRVAGRVRHAGGLGRALPDLALVRLDDCPGRRLGWYELAAPRADPRGPVDLAGYARDRGMRQLSRQRACRIVAAAGTATAGAGWLLHDCASREGASGAPLLDPAAPGAPLVVAINAGELAPVRDILPGFTAAHANIAIPSAALGALPAMLAAIRRDRAGQANPLAR